MPYDYVNRRCETSSHISKRVHSMILYRVFNVNDRFVLRSRSHQGSDRQINVSCIVAGCYPQDTPVRVVETTMVIPQFYSDSDGIVPSARQDHKTSYIEDITKLLQIKIKFKSFVAKHPNITTMAINTAITVHGDDSFPQYVWISGNSEICGGVEGEYVSITLNAVIGKIFVRRSQKNRK